VLIAADDEAGAEVDCAGADVCVELLAELLLELHAAAVIISVTPAARAGMTFTARPVWWEACWCLSGRALGRRLERVIFPSSWLG
jgi:hypothetical protein